MTVPQVSKDKTTERYPFRVFISYAHEDVELVRRIDRILTRHLIPVWDRGIRPGESFTDEIKRQIATAHVFMPVITERSRDKPWVHQEIGFANGIDIPVVAVSIGSLPEGMIAGIQSLHFEDNLSSLSRRLREIDLEALVLSAGRQSELQRLAVSSQVADSAEQRTQLLLTYVRSISTPARVRQRAFFSSFSFPKGGPDDPHWKPMLQDLYRSEYFRDLLSQERQVLESHAREAGCSLILNPFIDFEAVGPAVHRAQLGELLAFLKCMPPKRLTLAICENGMAGNLTLVGDWMLATVVPPQPGCHYRGTFLTRHAPTVIQWLRKFDDEFDAILSTAGVSADDSRDMAISRIEKRLRDLPPE